jgi:hypothetical protein
MRFLEVNEPTVVTLQPGTHLYVRGDAVMIFCNTEHLMDVIPTLRAPHEEASGHLLEPEALWRSAS